MKDINVTKRMSIAEFIEQHLEDYTKTAVVFQLKPDENDLDGVSAKQVSINCDLFNILPEKRDGFRMIVEKTYYKQQVTATEKALQAKDEQIAKTSNMTDKMIKDRANLALVLSEYEKLLDLYCEIEGECKFASFMASAFTGISVEGVAIQPILSALANEGNTDRHDKDVINNTLHALSRTADEFVKPYTLNCNGKLLQDIKARYYRGRRQDKTGTVNRTFDTNGKQVRREIILAVVEHMQKKELFERECEEFTGEQDTTTAE